jgi:hypothetical protein
MNGAASDALSEGPDAVLLPAPRSQKRLRDEPRWSRNDRVRPVPPANEQHPRLSRVQCRPQHRRQPVCGSPSTPAARIVCGSPSALESGEPAFARPARRKRSRLAARGPRARRKVLRRASCDDCKSAGNTVALAVDKVGLKSGLLVVALQVAPSCSLLHDRHHQAACNNQAITCL